MSFALCDFGHVASYQELLEHYHGQESAIVPLRYSYARRLVLHPRPNVYVCAHLDDDALAAARVGGWLDCATVLARHSFPIAEPTHLHLRFRPSDGRASARRRAEPRPTRAHWSVPSWPVPTARETQDVNRHRGALNRAALNRTTVSRTALNRTALNRTARDRTDATRGPHGSPPPSAQSPLSRLEMPLDEAMRQALTSCLTMAESVAVIDAALPLLGAGRVAEILRFIPDRKRAALRRAGLPAELDAALKTLR